MNSQLDYFTTTIANGETVSGAVDINGARVMLLHMPAALTGTKMHLQVSMDGVTYQQLYSDGALLEWTVAAGKTIKVAADEVHANYIKVCSGSAEGGARTIGVTTFRV